MQDGLHLLCSPEDECVFLLLLAGARARGLVVRVLHHHQGQLAALEVQLKDFRPGINDERGGVRQWWMGQRILNVETTKPLLQKY